jgi:hypothetical protein
MLDELRADENLLSYRYSLESLNCLTGCTDSGDHRFLLAAAASFCLPPMQAQNPNLFEAKMFPEGGLCCTPDFLHVGLIQEPRSTWIISLPIQTYSNRLADNSTPSLTALAELTESTSPYGSAQYSHYTDKRWNGTRTLIKGNG